jgi:hypothetical protein
MYHQLREYLHPLYWMAGSNIQTLPSNIIDMHNQLCQAWLQAEKTWMTKKSMFSPFNNAYWHQHT